MHEVQGVGSLSPVFGHLAKEWVVVKVMSSPFIIIFFFPFVVSF